MTHTNEQLVSYPATTDDESLLSLLLLTIYSLENLADVIGSIPYVLANPHLIHGMPLQEPIQAYKEALETQMEYSLQNTTSTEGMFQIEDFLINGDHIFMVESRGSAHRQLLLIS